MREIKFRGMLRSGEWVYGGYVKIQNGANCILSGECDNLDIGDGVKNILRFNAVKYKTVGEYTGLKDKNGKEIYEGDIITFKYANLKKWRVAEISWGTGGFWVCGWWNKIKDHKEFEVIGNIYENGSLIQISFFLGTSYSYYTTI